jgi:hypothetical protein
MKILLDVFPAHTVAAAPGQFEHVEDIKSDPATPETHYVGTTRVILTEEMIIVAQDSPEGAKIIFRERYHTFLPGTENRVVTDSGKMLAFKKDTNCGCGSRLRGWNPYKTLNSIKDPL